MRRKYLFTNPNRSLFRLSAISSLFIKDDKGVIQVFGVSPNGGKIIQLTNNPYSVQGPFNFSPDGKYIAYLADNSVFVTEIKPANLDD